MSIQSEGAVITSEWLSGTSSRTCLLCQADTASDVLRCTAALFWRCENCGCWFADPFMEADDLPSPLSWHYYLETAAGLEEMLQPLLALDGSAGASLLDVGCAMGLIVDCWIRTGLGPALGVEPSAPGQEGAQMLGAPVLAQLPALGQEPVPDGFDIVYASEVVEHVEDPRGFMAALKDRLKPGGVLVLTTPDAGAATPDLAVNDLLPMIAPGHHRFLFSGGFLRSQMQEFGLTHVEVVRLPRRLVVYGSEHPVSLGSGAVEDRAVAYLDSVVSDDRLQARLRSAAAARLLKLRTNRGEYEEASQVAAALTRLWQQAFDAGLDDLVGRALADADPAEFWLMGQRAPFSLALSCYYLGLLARVRDRNLQQAIQLFDQAITLATVQARTPEGFFLQARDLLPYMRLEWWTARRDAGESRQAANGLRSLRQELDDSGQRVALRLRITAELVKTAMWSGDRRALRADIAEALRRTEGLPEDDQAVATRAWAQLASASGDDLAPGRRLSTLERLAAQWEERVDRHPHAELSMLAQEARRLSAEGRGGSVRNAGRWRLRREV